MQTLDPLLKDVVPPLGSSRSGGSWSTVTTESVAIHRLPSLSRRPISARSSRALATSAPGNGGSSSAPSRAGSPPQAHEARMCRRTGVSTSVRSSWPARCQGAADGAPGAERGAFRGGLLARPGSMAWSCSTSRRKNRDWAWFSPRAAITCSVEASVRLREPSRILGRKRVRGESRPQGELPQREGLRRGLLPCAPLAADRREKPGLSKRSGASNGRFLARCGGRAERPPKRTGSAASGKGQLRSKGGVVALVEAGDVVADDESTVFVLATRVVQQ